MNDSSSRCGPGRQEGDKSNIRAIVLLCRPRKGRVDSRRNLKVTGHDLRFSSSFIGASKVGRTPFSRLFSIARLRNFRRTGGSLAFQGSVKPLAKVAYQQWSG